MGDDATEGRTLRLERLSARGFRNLAPLELRPGPRFNVFAGDNGEGKSNLLEAIYLTGALRSFRGAGRDELIARDADGCAVEARLAMEPLARTARVTLHRRRARTMHLDGKRPRSKAAWLSTFQMVLFHPGDLGLATGSPEGRRTYLDRILEQMDATFATTAAAYLKALRSRNRLLKRSPERRAAIVAYDELLASAGAVVARSRAELAAELAPLTREAWRQVAGEELPLAVTYRARVEGSAAGDVEALRRALAGSLDRDVARGFTGEGPHADDLALEVEGRRARHHASQGQHRMIVLALKMAELAVLSRRVGRVPILLLDDVSSELDRRRSRRLFELLDRLGGQVFLTTTHPELILIDHHRLDHRVEAGRVTDGG